MSRRSKKRTNRGFQRQVDLVDRHDRVLIVCEDSVSSPNYFNDLVRSERLSSVDVEITGDCGSDPMSVVNEAISRYEQSVNDNITASTFDNVYCVIDRDDHNTFNEAINKVKELKKSGKPFHIIRSYPSFEFWYLCHFKYTRASIGKAGAKSSGKECEKLLNVEWKNHFKKKYSKNMTGIYKLLRDKLSSAISNAKGTLREAEATNEMNPSTEVHQLVDYLINIRK